MYIHTYLAFLILAGLVEVIGLDGRGLDGHGLDGRGLHVCKVPTKCANSLLIITHEIVTFIDLG